MRDLNGSLAPPTAADSSASISSRSRRMTSNDTKAIQMALSGPAVVAPQHPIHTIHRVHLRRRGKETRLAAGIVALCLVHQLIFQGLGAPFDHLSRTSSTQLPRPQLAHSDRELDSTRSPVAAPLISKPIHFILRAACSVTACATFPSVSLSAFLITDTCHRGLEISTALASMVSIRACNLSKVSQETFVVAKVSSLKRGGFKSDTHHISMMLAMILH